MSRQKSALPSYKDISHIEESVESLCLPEGYSDKKFDIKEIFDVLKYVSETISYFKEIAKSKKYEVQVCDVVDFLYLNYFLYQLKSVNSILEFFQSGKQYHPKIELLLKNVKNLINKVKLILKNERFQF